MFSRIIAVALALSVLLLLPAGVDTAKRKKPRFKIIERTYDAEPFISVAGIARATRYPDTIEVNGPRDSRINDIDLHLYGFSHAAVPDLDLQADREDGVDAGDRHDGAPRSDLGEQLHQFTARREPRMPFGRTSSTSTMIAKPIVVL